MKKKSISLLFALFSLLLCRSSFAECEPSEKTGYDEYNKGKYSYECNVKNLCIWERYGRDAWNFDTSKQLIMKHTMGKYPDLAVTQDLTFKDIRKIYEDYQNNIMDCAVLKSKYALHKKIIDDYDGISERAKWILEEANEIIKEKMENMLPQKCTDPRDDDKIYVNKDLLDSLSYELCGYNMYLYYYERALAKNIGLLKAGRDPRNINEWREVLATERNSISLEYDLNRRTMDTALSMYENFERTYIAHVLLEMIEVELTENKRYIWGIVRVIMELMELFSNAMGHEKNR